MNNSKKYSPLPNKSDKLSKEIFEKLIQSISSEFYRLSGYDFLNYITKFCAQTLEVDFIYISEFDTNSNKITVKAGFEKGKPTDDLEFNIENAPLKALLQNDFICYPENVNKEFPGNKKLKKFNIQGFAGIPLRKKEGNIFGMFYLCSSRKINNVEIVDYILRFFSGRISSELNLIKKEEQLIRSEKKYKALFDSAIDAIFVVKDTTIIEVNSMTIEMFGCQNNNDLIGKTVLDFSPEKQPDGSLSKDKALHLINETLKGKPQKFYWQHSRKDKTVFDTEVSINQLQIEGATHFQAVVRDITERKKVESLLKQSEERYRSIFENLHDVLYITDLKGTILELSPSIKFHFGYDRDKLLGTSVYDVYYDSTERDTFLNAIKQKGIVNDYEIALKTEFGDKVYCSANARLVFDENGIPKQVEGILRNITERKLNEEKLRISEQRFRKAQEVAKIGTFEFDVKNSIYWGSDEAKKIFGFSVDSGNVSAIQLREYFVDKDKTSAILDDALKNMDSYDLEYEILQFGTHEKRIINSIAEIKRDEAGSPVKVLGLIADITEKKHAEQELISAKEKAEKNEKKLKEASEIAKLGSWEFDIETNLFTFTDNFYKIFHTSATEMGGYQMTIEDYYKQFIHPDDAHLVANETKKAVESTNPNFSNYFEHKIVYKDGGTGYIGVRFFIAKDKFSNSIKCYGVNQDITERKIVEQELIKAKERAEESDKLKTSFLLNISHEIRTPMNGILGFLNLLKNPDLSEIEKSDFIDVVNKSGDRLMNTINDIVEISKIETGDTNLVIQEMDISEVMHYHFNFFRLEAEKKGIELVLKDQVKGNSALVKTDKHKLDGILMNLIKNAVKFTSKGKIEIGNYLENDKLNFYVSDTGCGIPKDKMNVIFERFAQAEIGLNRNYEGSGIGLSIVKAHVQALNGEIKVESKVGEGSTFRFHIPYNPVKTTHDQRNGTKTLKEASNQITLLIAEDDEVNIFLLKSMLSNDFKLLFATNGEESIQLVQENPDISLILMDIKMPGKYDGLETTQKIRQFNKKIPIIAQTAYAQNSDKIKAIDAGCNDYISKPFNAKELKLIISKYC